MEAMPAKYPGSIKRYGCDWKAPRPRGPWLGDTETIATSTWYVAGPTTVPALTLATPAGTHDTTTTAVLVSGGKAGTTYYVANVITTSDGQTEVQVLAIPVDTIPSGA